MKDYNFFFGRIYFTSNDGSQSMFVYQETLDTLELKKDKCADYVISWKSNGVYNSKPKPLYTAFLQNNYLNKIANLYIVNDLAAWPRTPTNNLKFKNCLFGATNIVKNRNKEKYVDSVYRITFNITYWRSFGNDTARNVMIFGVDSSSSSHVDNHKNNFLI